jgi:hypothetical protein
LFKIPLFGAVCPWIERKFTFKTGSIANRLWGENDQPTVTARHPGRNRYEEVSFSDWLAHSPPDMVAATFNLAPEVVARFPKNRPDLMPG